MSIEVFRDQFSVELMGDDPNWVYSGPKTQETALIVYTLRGGGNHRSTWTIGQETFTLKNEWMLIAPPEMKKSAKGNEMFAVMTVPAYIYEQAYSFTDGKIPREPMTVRLRGAHSFYVDFQFATALVLYTDKHPIWELEATIRVLNLMGRAFEIVMDSTIPEIPEFCRPEHSAEHRINNLVEFMATNLETKATVPEMAEKCLMSEATFHRKFKRVTGYTPHQFLLRLRLAKAREMLTSTEASISAAAYESGFRSLQNFNHAFRMHMGQSPSEFREMNQSM